MSYHIVQGLKVNENNEVWIKGSDNNIYPRHFRWYHCTCFTNLLANEGKETLDIEILKDYENGNMQEGTKNKYTSALKRLYYMFADEYEKFDWRASGVAYEKAKELRKTQAFNDLLKKAMYSKNPKGKYIITKQHYTGEIVYLWKTTRLLAKWTYDKKRAKVFDFEAEAKNTQRHFNSSDNWKIERK